MAEQDSGEASQKYKEVHDRTATEHNLQVGDKVQNLKIKNSIVIKASKSIWLKVMVILKANKLPKVN